ncbi:hypothetical protein V1527DRAFT_467717 [Lipomyces starkeyi]
MVKFGNLKALIAYANSQRRCDILLVEKIWSGIKVAGSKGGPMASQAISINVQRRLFNGRETKARSRRYFIIGGIFYVLVC